ncbi:hypothetical protein EIP91_002275, partial [Steccherinum ochraceum]
ATNQPSKGTLLFHPGAPGALRKQFVTRHAHILWSQVGKGYDIVGFDARGTGESEPKVSCFTHMTAGGKLTNNPRYTHATFMHNTVLDIGYQFPLNVTTQELRQIILPQARAVDALPRTQHLKYMGTTSVVRDMEMIKAQLDGKDAPMQVLVSLQPMSR